MYSLGFIETMGYVPAFQVADTMAKAADVEIVKMVWVGAGLVTIVIKGEISAIHTALDAGAAAANQTGCLEACLAVAHPAKSLVRMIGIEE